MIVWLGKSTVNGYIVKWELPVEVSTVEPKLKSYLNPPFRL